MRSRIFALLASILLVVCLISTLAGCGDKEKNEKVTRLTEGFLDAIIANDPDTAYSLMTSGVSRAEFDTFFSQIRKIFDGVKSYKLSQTGWYASIDNGITSYKVTFNMKADNGSEYQVETTITDGYENISYIHITSTATAAPASPLLIPFKIIMPVISIATITFAVWMIVDCAKRKLSKKALWIIVILLGASVTLTVGNGFSINWMVGLAFASSSVKASGGALSIRLAAPVGAIIYFIIRKKLTKSTSAPVIDDTIEVVNVDGADATVPVTETIEGEEKNNATENE
jgi:hypothetical protein